MQPPQIRAITDEDWPSDFEIFHAVVAGGDARYVEIACGIYRNLDGTSGTPLQ